MLNRAFGAFTVVHLYIPNSIKVALAIGHCIGNRALGIKAYERNAMRNALLE